MTVGSSEGQNSTSHAIERVISDMGLMQLARSASTGELNAGALAKAVELLRARGVHFIGPEEGMLACGYEGTGRLWKVDDIAFRAEFFLARKDKLIA